MAAEHGDAAAAFDLLRRASHRENRKLHDIASDLVASAADRHRRRLEPGRAE